MSTENLKISSRIHNYELRFESNLSFINELLKIDSAVFLVDEKVKTTYPNCFETLIGSNKLILINAIEEHKTLSYLETIYDAIVNLKINKSSTIVSIGGGITQDLSGFVASTFFRGLRWIYVPTTLLAQSDSCLGSKTSLNYKKVKNMLGTFYPPHEVYLAPQFLETLDELDFYSGMGEVVKLHIMGGSTEVDKLQSLIPQIKDRNLETMNTLIRSSLEVKWSYMADDEFDTGKRNLLNYGHCFGHAIETCTNYKIPHGQAVLLGMLLANKVANARQLLTNNSLKRLNQLILEHIIIDFSLLITLEHTRLIEIMKSDKKRIGSKLPIILIDELFELRKELDLTETEVEDVLSWLKKKYCI